MTAETRCCQMCVRGLDLKKVLLLYESGFPGVVCIIKLNNTEGLGSKLFKLNKGLQVSVWEGWCVLELHVRHSSPKYLLRLCVTSRIYWFGFLLFFFYWCYTFVKVVVINQGNSVVWHRFGIKVFWSIWSNSSLDYF